MPYEYGQTEALLESDEAFVHDEGWEREWSEAFPRYRPAYSPAGRVGIPTPRPAQPVPGVKGGTIQTPGGGKAQITLPAAVATKEAVDAIVKELKADIAKNAEAVRKVDQTLDKNTSVLDKKIGAVQGDLKKSQQQSQFGMILPLLLTKPPEIESITQKGGQKLDIEQTRYKSGDNTGLLLAMMMMGGGLGAGGGNGGDSQMMPLLLVLALGGLK